MVSIRGADCIAAEAHTLGLFCEKEFLHLNDVEPIDSIASDSCELLQSIGDFESN